MTEENTIVSCGKCGETLDEPASTPVQKRNPCPICSSKSRHIEKVIAVTSTARSGLRGKARTGLPGQPGSKPWLTTMSEPSWSYDRQKWVHREKTEDRRNNWYSEKVTDPDTGEVIHEAGEPLTDHRGHGIARKKK
jgi:hypothetical protein